MEPLDLSAREIARLVGTRELTAVEVVQAWLSRLHRTEPSLLAFRRVDAERAQAQAHALDGRLRAGEPAGALCGVPVALKDLFVTRGLETTAGSRILGGWVPSYEGTHAARLSAAGAIGLGKLAMDEFGMGSSSENTPHEPVRNPWALDHVAGGSSGGSAAAVAAGSCSIALGTDTGGSIRQPASLCGVVGLKPTWGRVSRHGMIAFASSLDQAGPLARDVRDAALALSVLAGADPLDATCARCPVPDYQAACDRGIAGVRIGIHRPALEGPGVDADVRRRCEAALEVLRARGAVIVEIELPHFRYAVAAYYVICTAEASSNLARYDGLRYGPRGVGSELDAVVRAARSAGFGAEVKRRVMLGTFVLRADSYERYYGRAMRVRARIADDYRRAFERCDVLASPTFPIAGFRRGERIDDPLALYLADAFTVGPSLAGLPAISIPAGFSSGPPELPIGLQLVGRSFDEETILAVAAAHEADTSWHARRPPEVS